MKQQAAQVYFPLPLYMEIKQIALEEGVPFAALVRETMEKRVKKGSKKRKSLADLPTYSFPGIETDISQRVDEIVYGNT